MSSSLIDPLIYSSYEKITDDLYWLSSNLLLRFNVTLAYYDKENGKRTTFHKEFKYPSNKTSYNYLKTIRRNFDFYLSLESYYKKNIEEKVFIPIKVQDIISIRIGLQVVFSWFNDKQYDGLYATKNGKLIITSPTPSYVIDHLPGGSYIEFKPIIIEKSTGVDDKEPGIYMGLSDSYGVRLTLNRFMGFKYIIDSINMYESAQLLLNYFGRPEFGSFLYSFSSEDSTEASIWERQDSKQNINSKKDTVRRVLPGNKSIENLE